MKKAFEYLGLLSLMCFSFFITEKTVTVIQEVDDIMVQIRENKDKYYKEGLQATIYGDYIIPGISSRDVNVEKSYQAMKKIGVYDYNFLVFDITEPNITINNSLDKYIVKGNYSKRMVSLIFLVDENQIEDIINKIGNIKVSFVVRNYEKKSDSRNIKKIKEQGHEILVYEEKSKGYSSYMKKMNELGVVIKYCYNANKDQNFLDLCKKNKQSSIYSNNIITKKPLQSIKSILEPGAIIVLEASAALSQELPNIISYIEHKGYKIESLDTHLQEN